MKNGQQTVASQTKQAEYEFIITNSLEQKKNWKKRKSERKGERNRCKTSINIYGYCVFPLVLLFDSLITNPRFVESKHKLKFNRVMHYGFHLEIEIEKKKNGKVENRKSNNKRYKIEVNYVKSKKFIDWLWNGTCCCCCP